MHDAELISPLTPEELCITTIVKQRRSIILMWCMMPAHGTILINFGSEKRSYIFSFSLTSRGLSPSGRCSGPAGDLSGPQTTRQEVRPLAESTGSTPIIYEVPMLCMWSKALKIATTSIWRTAIEGFFLFQEDMPMPVCTWSGTGQQRRVWIFIAMERWVERTKC
jgi:hypothetical protein